MVSVIGTGSKLVILNSESIAGVVWRLAKSNPVSTEGAVAS